MGFQVGKSVSDHTLHAVAVGKNESHAGSVHAAHVLFDEAIERFVNGFVGAGAALRQRFDGIERARGADRGCGGCAKEFPSIHLVVLAFASASNDSGITRLRQV